MRLAVRLPLLLLLLLFLLSAVVLARPASNFGFGPPPAYLDLTRKLRSQLSLDESDSLVISLPTIGCIDRGHPGRRDVCGYRFCLRAKGEVAEVWLTNGFGIQGNPRGDCAWNFTAWLGDPAVEVAEFCDYQPKHPHCKTGRREGLVKLTVEESTGALELARKAAEKDRVEQEQLAELRAEAEAKQAAENAQIADIKKEGPVRAYPSLAAHRYRTCQSLANAFLQSELKDAEELYELGLESIKKCAHAQEGLLSQEARAALKQSPARASEMLKDLHAYAVASLRALTNFHQSVIEARQARAERMAGIDERTARLELELP